MEKTVEYVIEYAEDCQLRERFIKSHGAILGFAVQLEVKIKEEWMAIRRYDTAHGFFHCDKISASGHTEKHPIPAANLNEALTVAEHDLRQFWKVYRDEFLKGVKNYEK